MKFKAINALKSGWTRWQMPVMRGYLMACCDCGLVHEMEFEAVLVGRKKTNGYIEVESLDPSKYRVRMRARRAE